MQKKHYRSFQLITQYSTCITVFFFVRCFGVAPAYEEWFRTRSTDMQSCGPHKRKIYLQVIAKEEHIVPNEVEIHLGSSIQLALVEELKIVLPVSWVNYIIYFLITISNRRWRYMSWFTIVMNTKRWQ